jgi:hypothetical protein
VAVGTLGGYNLFSITVDDPDVRFVFPWAQMLTICLSVWAASLLFTIVPAVRASRIPAVEALGTKARRDHWSVNADGSQNDRPKNHTGRLLENARRELGLSLEEAARRTGIPAASSKPWRRTPLTPPVPSAAGSSSGTTPTP